MPKQIPNPKQISNPKFQTNFKSQIPDSGQIPNPESQISEFQQFNIVKYWNLGFGDWNLSGIWDFQN